MKATQRRCENDELKVRDLIRKRYLKSGLLPTPMASDYISKPTSKSWSKRNGINWSWGSRQLLYALVLAPGEESQAGGSGKEVGKPGKATEGEKNY